MSESDEITLLRLHPRATETVPLVIPADTLATIKQVAETRDMSPEALMRFYIGHGLRQDTARLFSERNDARPPNATTQRSLEDAEARRGLTSFSTPDELFNDLGI
jgi:hypothetical protein